MKINRWVALALIAVLVVGAMGLVTYRVLASTNLLQTQDCPQDVEENAAHQTAEAEDADVEDCGNQLDDESGNGDVNEATEANGQDQADESTLAVTGITAEQAQAIVEAANPGIATLNVEFDRESHKEVWEVELDNGLDVKVDATTGEILSTEKRD